MHIPRHEPQDRSAPQREFDIVLAHLRFLTMIEVCALTTYTPTHIYRLERQGKFPRRRRIGPNRIGFLLHEVEKWMSDRPVADLSDDEE